MKTRYRDTGTDTSETHSCTCGKSTSPKAVKGTQRGKNRLFHKGAVNNVYPQAKDEAIVSPHTIYKN